MQSNNAISLGLYTQSNVIFLDLKFIYAKQCYVFGLKFTYAKQSYVFGLKFKCMQLKQCYESKGVGLFVFLYDLETLK